MFERLFDEISIDCSTIPTGNIIFPLSGGIMAGRTICLMHSRWSSSVIVAIPHPRVDIVCCHCVVGITRNRIYKVLFFLVSHLHIRPVTRVVSGFATIVQHTQTAHKPITFAITLLVNCFEYRHRH